MPNPLKKATDYMKGQADSAHSSQADSGVYLEPPGKEPQQTSVGEAEAAGKLAEQTKAQETAGEAVGDVKGGPQ